MTKETKPFPPYLGFDDVNEESARAVIVERINEVAAMDQTYPWIPNRLEELERALTKHDKMNQIQSIQVIRKKRVGIMVTITVLVAIILWGYQSEEALVWIPLSGAIANAINYPFRGWVASERLGANVAMSVMLKFVLSLIGLYGLIAFYISIGLLISWILL